MTFEQTRWIGMAVMIAWTILIIYFWKADNGDGKKKSIATFLTLGLYYPFMKDDAQRPLKKREIFGFMLVLLLIGIAVTLNLLGVF